MLVSAGNGFKGYEVEEYKDVVFGFASLQDDILYRETALQKACSAAEAKGANAIINMHMEIYSTSESNQEATVYGDAVVVKSVNDKLVNNPKIDFEAYMPREKSKVAGVLEVNGFKFVTCPSCGTKYKTDVDKNGKLHIKGFEDVDNKEPGLQIHCLRCGTKFTVPES